MNECIKDRVIAVSNYIIENNATVRSAGQAFHVGKSTVHKDVTGRLKRIDGELYKKVRKILNTNLNERHIRGGIATKKKFEFLRKNKNV